MLSELDKSKKVIGIKQCRKAIKDGEAVKVFVAGDAERRLVGPLIEACEEAGTDCVLVPTMKELGEACGIDVGAAIAAIV